MVTVDYKEGDIVRIKKYNGNAYVGYAYKPSNWGINHILLCPVKKDTLKFYQLFRKSINYFDGEGFTKFTIESYTILS